jgi:hypothetical protein
MNNSTQIIETYKKAEFEKRLNLFLSYRSLRNQFTKIDNKDRQSSCGYSVAIKPQLKNRAIFQRLMLWWGIK